MKNITGNNFFNTSGFVFLCGIASLLLAILVGFSGYNYFFNAIDKTFQRSQLNQAKRFAAYVEKVLYKKNNSDALKDIQLFWDISTQKSSDEYICIVNKQSVLILHSKNPQIIGSNAGKNLLVSDNYKKLGCLADLSKKPRDYVGGYIASSGENQIASFAPVKGRNWTIGIHRSKNALHREIRSKIKFLAIAYIIICGMLLPISLYLMYKAIKKSQKKEHEALDSLIESENRIRLMIQQSPSVIELYDMDGTQLDVNQAYEELWGFPASHTVDKFNVLKSEEVKRTGLLAYVKRAYAGELVEVPEYEFNPTGETEAQGLGRKRWLHTRIYPLKDHDDHVRNIVITHEDITNRKNIEKKLAESEQHFRASFELAATGIAHVSLEGKWLKVNQKLCNIVGYSQEEMQKLTFQDITHQDDLTADLAYVKQLLDGEISTYSMEKRYICKNKSIVWILLTVALVKDENGNPEYFISIIEDINEHKLHRMELEQSEIMFRTAFYQSFQFMAILDSSGKVINVNDLIYEVCGDRPENIIGKYIWEAWWWDMENPTNISLENDIKKAAAGIMTDDEITFYDKENKIHTAHRIISPVKNKNGEVVYISIKGQDITERKKALEDLKQSQYYLEKAQKIGQFGAWELDMLKNDLVWADENYRVFEVAPGKKLTYEIFLNCIHPEDRELVDKAWKEALKGADYDIEHRLLRDSKIKWVREKADLSFDENGIAVSAIGFTQDITSRKLAEIALLESEKKYKLLVENQSDLIVKINLKGEFLYVSQSYCEFFGKTEAELLGSHFKPLIHEDDLEMTMKEMENLYREPYTCYVQQRVMTKDGWRWLAWADKAILDKYNNVIEIVATGRDITERNQAEAQLKVALAEAKLANTAKSEFLATMSHEIRTPLNGILGFSEIIKDELPFDKMANPEEIKDYFESINQCGTTLLGIINDILELSIIESGQFQKSLKKFSPLELISDSVKAFKFKALEKKLKLNFESENLPEILIGDQRRLKQINFNLIGNAVKFTSSGDIMVTANYAENQLFVAVSDTGIGIEKEKLKLIFDPFYQVNQSSTRQAGGTGLGLAIVKRQLEKLGGNIKVDSEKGKGTTVRIMLPVTIPDKKTNKSKIAPFELKAFSAGLKVLAIEDDPVSIRYLEKVMAYAKYDFKITASFEEMKDVCEENTFDVALVDIALPGADGYVCLKWLKSKYNNQKIVYIAQTAHALSDAREKCLEMGFDDFIAKPYKRSDLLKLIQKNLDP
jgi:PAS domain S-box-containing protein